MKCPKCNVEISFVRVYSEIWQKGYLNEQGEIEGYGAFEEPCEETTSIECPECDQEIEIVEAT